MDSGEINYLNANDNAYAPDIDVDGEEAEESYVGASKCEDEQASLGDKEGVAKQAGVAPYTFELIVVTSICC